MFSYKEWETGFLNLNTGTISKDVMHAKTDVSGSPIYFECVVTLADMAVEHYRRVYGVLDLAADFGGNLGAFVYVLAFIFMPWSEHNFQIKAVQKLFNVLTKRES